MSVSGPIHHVKAEGAVVDGVPCAWIVSARDDRMHAGFDLILIL